MTGPSGGRILDAWEDGVGHVQMGASTFTTFADAVTLVDLRTGVTDGIWYPESCLSPCE